MKFNSKQLEALAMLKGSATHNLLYGGSRSGKTFVIVAAMLARALRVKSRHAILRFRFNHVKTSIAYDTLPKVIESGLFKGLKGYLDKTDWFFRLPNGSEIWFGGLDDKERTEKILGQEYATLFLNECSQIPWASRNIAVTRLAQNVGIPLKAYYDCNPPSQAHWTYKLFMRKQSPDEGKPLLDVHNYCATRINPIDNQENLAPEYLNELKALPERDRRRFLLGEFGSGEADALWTPELIEQQRVASGILPTMQKVLVAVDPSGCSGPDDARSDEIGIVVVGLGDDGKGYVLEDASGRFGPTQWGQAVSDLCERYGASQVIAESNFGGAMVTEVLRTANASLPVRIVKASSSGTGGKAARAEGIANLFEAQKAYLAGHFPRLEEQLCSMTTAGYTGSKSPDRADAMVWGLMSLFPAMTRRELPHPAYLPKVVLGHSGFKRRSL